MRMRSFVFSSRSTNFIVSPKHPAFLCSDSVIPQERGFILGISEIFERTIYLIISNSQIPIILTIERFDLVVAISMYIYIRRARNRRA